MRALSKNYVPLIGILFLAGMLVSCVESTTDPWEDLAATYDLTVTVINETQTPYEADIWVETATGEMVESTTGTNASFTLDSATPYMVKATAEFTSGGTETQEYAAMLAKDRTHTFTFITGDIEANLIAHYPMDSDLADAFGSNGAGSVTGNRIDNSGGTITFAGGAVDNGAVFDGLSGVRLPDGLIGDYDYSVAFWIHPDVLSQYTTAFFSAISPDIWLSVVPVSWNSETMLWSNNDGSWFDGITGMTVPADEWTHLAIVIEDGVARMFIDGTQVFTTTGFGDLFSGGTSLSALAVNYWDVPFEGMMDDLYIYDAAIGAKTIANLMAEAN